MQLIENQLYHIYNQGNNRQRIFFSERNYQYFLLKVKKFIRPNCHIISYCLMPNHFHFLIYTNQKSLTLRKVGGLQLTELTNGFRLLLSSYAQAINKQENRTGSLFRQKTKVKPLTNTDTNYPLICFNYIHQNPVKSQLVNRMEKWKFSSFNEYNGKSDSICNQQLACDLIGLDLNAFYDHSYQLIPSESIDKIL